MSLNWAGAYVRSVTGELWGRVVLDQGRSWQLASGRSAKKENLGRILGLGELSEASNRSLLMK